MDSKDKIYLLRSKLTNSNGDKTDHCSFERLIRIRFLHETGRNATFYDKELKMHFADPSALAWVYEIETVDFFVNASSRLSKAREFIRRMGYKYDWIQLKANARGIILAIENKDELRTRWFRLKSAILKDYKGRVVEKTIRTVDEQFNKGEQIDASVFQYIYWGLIFPSIPRKHNQDWENKRVVEFSEYEKEKFEETIRFVKAEDGLRHYEITGNAIPNSPTKIIDYKGYMNSSMDDIFPCNVNVNIEFERDSIINNWRFDLLLYNT